jgi:hypothetical protein
MYRRIETTEALCVCFSFTRITGAASGELPGSIKFSVLKASRLMLNAQRFNAENPTLPPVASAEASRRICVTKPSQH